MLRKTLSLLFLIACLAPAHAAPPNGKGGGKDKDDGSSAELYEYVGLGNLGGQDVFTYDLNESNEVVGSSTTLDGVWHAFWSTSDSDATRLPLIDLNDFVDAADDLVLDTAFQINDGQTAGDYGQIVGQAQTTTGRVGFLLTPPVGATLSFDTNGKAVFLVEGTVTSPQITTLLPPFAVEAEARAINSYGSVVGPYLSESGDLGVFIYQWDANTGAFVFHDLGAPAGATGGSTANSINDANEIAGTSDFGADGLGAWKYTEANSFVDLGVLDENVSLPEARSTAMNGFGDVVGSSTVVLSSKGKKQTEGEHGFVANDGVMVDIGDIAPNDINDIGDIAATSNDGVCVLFSDPNVGLVNINAAVQLPPDLADLNDPLHMPAINNIGIISGYSGDSFAGVSEEAFLLLPLP